MIDVQVKTTGLSDLIKSVIDLPGVFARARRSAIRSLGWSVRQDFIRIGRQLRPRLNPHTGVLSVTHGADIRFGQYVKWVKKRKLGKDGKKRWQRGTSRLHGTGGGVAQKLSSREQPFSRWINMIRYYVDVEDLIAEIGILKPKTNYFLWMAKNRQGFNTPVTPKMRRFLFAAGFPIKKTTTKLVTPARRWIDEVESRWNTKAATYFEAKFWAEFDRYTKSQTYRMTRT